MTAQEKEDWLKGKDLGQMGWDLRPSAVRLHGSNETTKHLLIKALIAKMLQREGRRWDTEVVGPDGRVDVLDLGPPDGKAVAYEVQTNATPQEKRDKVEQYVGGPVRDVIFLDPAEAPNSVPELAAWVEQRVV